MLHASLAVGLLVTFVRSEGGAEDAACTSSSGHVSDSSHYSLQLLQIGRGTKASLLEQMCAARSSTSRLLTRDIDLQVSDCQGSVNMLKNDKKKPSFVINALGPRFDFCDLADVHMHYDPPKKHQKSCAVYCAFKECHAAENFIMEYEEILKEKCGSVHLFPDGAACFMKKDLAVKNHDRCKAFVDKDKSAMERDGGSGR